MNLAVVLDCEEHIMRKNLEAQGRRDGRFDDAPDAINNRIHNYKYNTIPICGHYDDQGKLIVVSIHSCFFTFVIIAIIVLGIQSVFTFVI